MKNPKTSRRLGYLNKSAAALASFALCASVSLAADVMVKLSGGEEVPPVSTTASGNGTITINPDMSVSGKVATSGVVGTMAHIHQAEAGKNGPVVIPLEKDGEHNWIVPAGAKLNEAQYQAYKAGQLYVNVHSAENKGGEIRGQLKP